MRACRLGIGEHGRVEEEASGKRLEIKEQWTDSNTLCSTN